MQCKNRFRQAAGQSKVAAKQFEGRAQGWMNVFDRLYFEAADRTARSQLRYDEAQNKMQAAFMAGFENFITIFCFHNMF